MRSLTKWIRDNLRNVIPVKTRTVRPPIYAGTISSISAMDVDTLHSIIESARAGDTRELFGLYQDIIGSCAHLQGEFAKRKLAVIGVALDIQPASDSPADVAAADAVRPAISSIPGFLNACSYLLDSTLWPVSVLEKTFIPVQGSRPGFGIRKLTPVPYHLLNFMTGSLRIADTDADGNPLGTFHDPDSRRYIIHRGHLLTSPDYHGGPMRAILFWWLLSTMDLDWWGRYLDRYGSPFLLGRYDQGDDQSRTILEKAFSYASRIGGLVVTRETEIEIKEAASSTASDSYERFITICEREMSKLVIGQTLSSEAQPTGMGSGVAQGQAAVRQDIRMFDALMLGTTLRDQLILQWMKINGISGQPPKLAWGGESSAAAKDVGALLANITQAGLRVTDEGIPTVSARLGIPVERTPAQPNALPFSISTLSASTPTPRLATGVESVARDASAGLAQAFRGSLAPVRRIILESHTPDECEQRLRDFYADWNPRQLTPLIAEALTAFASNGAANVPGLPAS